MALEEIKKNLIQTIKDLNYDQGASKILIDFIESYDGSNVERFSEAMLQAVIFMMSIQKLKIKANAFDELDENDEAFEANFNEMKDSFNRLNSGKELSTPSQST